MPLVAESFYNVVIFIRHEIIILNQEPAINYMYRFMAGMPGFEPGMSVLETLVIPFHYIPKDFAKPL